MDDRVSLARAVIKEAQAGGFEIGEMPEWDADILKLADAWYKEAKKEYKSGVKHPSVVAIVSLVDEQLEHGNTVVADERGEEPDHAQTAVEKTYPRRSSGGLSESDERDAEAFLENLPIPHEFQTDPSVMPSDLTVIGDKQIRKLSSEYNSYLGRAKWLLAMATNDLANATHLREAAFRKAYRDAHAEISKRGDRPTKDIVEVVALENETVSDFDAKIRVHQEHVTAYKALVEIYGGNVERLSREATLRQYEWERSR